MRVLVCGGRKFNDQKLLDEVLFYFDIRYDFTELIHGDCPTGADKMASDWAKICGKDRIIIRPFPADWSKHGRAAGPIRNQAMVNTRPDLVLAFPGGKGTRDLITRAKSAGLEVIAY